MQKFTPIEYLKIDIASNFGLDKKTWDFRLNWFAENEENLDKLIGEADEPALFYAGIQAYRKALAGKPSGYPISLDATASGAQILSILVGCEKSARLCNVIDTGDREDLYTNIFKVVYERIAAHHGLAQGDSNIMLPDLKQAKQAIMTWLYGSSAEPRAIFGEGDELSIFLETMHEMAPGISQLNEALIGLWQPDAVVNEWVLPDNFHVKIKVMTEVKYAVKFLDEIHEVTTEENIPSEFGLSLAANSVHSVDGMAVREVTRRCDYDKEQRIYAMETCMNAPTHSDAERVAATDNARMTQTLMGHYRATGFMSARLMEHIDANSIQLLSRVERNALFDMMSSMPKKPFSVLAIHDCFRVLPNYANDLRKQYNQVLHDIAQSNLLVSLTSQICNKLVDAPKFDDICAPILEANYALS